MQNLDQRYIGLVKMTDVLFPIDFNIEKTIEECAELVAALQKMKLKDSAGSTRADMVAELVDAKICIDVLFERFANQAIVKEKLDRLEKMVEEQNERNNISFRQ